MPETASVLVKSGLLSKINWVSFSGPLVSIAAAAGFDLSLEQAGGVILSVQVVQSLVTWVIRQWFTKSVTASSMKT